MSALIDRMAAKAAQLTTGGVSASHDPAWAHKNRPCILVTPPVLDYARGTLDGTPEVTWRLIALANLAPGTLDAVEQLDALVEHLDTVVGITFAEPARYTIAAKEAPIAAYICQTTEYA